MALAPNETTVPLPAGTVLAGFDAGIKEPTWAKMGELLGSEVAWAAVRKPYAVAGQRATLVPANTWYAGGVTVSVPANITVPHEPISAGYRYDMVVIRLDWTPTAVEGGGRASIVVIRSDTQFRLPTHQHDPGNVFDIPIAMSLIDSASAAPKSITSLHRSENKVSAVDSALAIPRPRYGHLAYVGTGANPNLMRHDGTAWRDVSPTTSIVHGSIRDLSHAQCAASPTGAWALSTITVPDPGYPYAIQLTGQLELDPKNRTKLWYEYANTSGTTAPPTLAPQYFLPTPVGVSGTGETKTLTTRWILGRTGQTFIRLMATIDKVDVKPGGSFATTHYNGGIDAAVMAR